MKDISREYLGDKYPEALEFIQQLEARIAATEAERDEAVMKKARMDNWGYSDRGLQGRAEAAEARAVAAEEALAAAEETLRDLYEKSRERSPQIVNTIAWLEAMDRAEVTLAALSSGLPEKTPAACEEPMRGLYGAASTCARPRGHRGNHASIWRHTDWPSGLPVQEPSDDRPDDWDPRDDSWAHPEEGVL